MAISASTSSVSSNALAADARSLNALKLDAGNSSPAAVKEAAKQFESLFMRELIKSMREATMKSGMLDSAGGDLGTDLLDQQMAVSMSGLPGGLSELIAKQLSKQNGGGDSLPAFTNPTDKADKTSATGNIPNYTPTVTGNATSRQANFVQRHTAAAQEVEKASGLPAGFMIGQAGHETGWGRQEIKNTDGSTSFNLFGIKAGAGWTGKVAQVTTTEYVNGEAKKTVAKFRAYGSYEESFRDYARLINESPRYAQARQQTGSAQAYATGLQRAGYATDPQYAAKLSRAINTSLNLQRVQT
jgi:flagellar protein FlgJ